MYVVLNIIRVKRSNLAEFVAGVRKHAEDSRSEPGCVGYDVLQDTEDPRTICLYEVFRDQAAFEEHLTYAYYKAWMQRSKDWRHSENRLRHVLDYIA